MNPSSSIVTMFPSSNGAGLPQSRISTEGNVSGILRDIASKNYVVSGLTASGWTPGIMWTTTGAKIDIAAGTCIINGYQITTNAIITLSKSNIPGVIFFIIRSHCSFSFGIFSIALSILVRFP